jgi:hypothetical protein
MLFRSRKSRFSERLSNHAVRIEIDLPVVLIITVRSHGKHRHRKIRLHNLDVRRRASQHVRDLGDRFPRMREFSNQFDAPVGIGRVILNIVPEYFDVTDDDRCRGHSIERKVGSIKRVSALEVSTSS